MAGVNRRTILAIDGGQSSTACLIGFADGTLLGSGLGGPAAVPSAELSDAFMQAALSASINKALEAVSPRPSFVDAAYLSLTGGWSAALAYLPKLIPTGKIKAESDSVAALASGTYGKPGIGLISGTGCVAYAQNSGGEALICGGWGYLLGDEGSGFWIGLQAVRAAIRAEDGRGPETPFTQKVISTLSIRNMREAQERIYNDRITRPEIALLAPLVMAEAEAGDAVARTIIEQAATELAELVKAACQKINFNLPEEKVIVVTGGVMHEGTLVYREFLKIIARDLPGYQIVIPRYPPVVGAFILGLKLSGIEITEGILQNIDAGLSRLPPQDLKT